MERKHLLRRCGDLGWLEEHLGFPDSFGRFTALNESEIKALIAVGELEDAVNRAFRSTNPHHEVEYRGGWWNERALRDRVSMLARSIFISVGLRHAEWVWGSPANFYVDPVNGGVSFFRA